MADELRDEHPTLDREAGVRVRAHEVGREHRHDALGGKGSQRLAGDAMQSRMADADLENEGEGGLKMHVCDDTRAELRADFAGWEHAKLARLRADHRGI